MRFAALRLLPARLAILLVLIVAVAGSSAAIGTSAPAGLVAAYSFSEGSGSTVSDSSGRDNTGTISGASRTTGKYGSGLSFDGLNDWVTIPDAASLDLSTGMTLEAWVRPTRLGGWRTIVFKERSGGVVYGLYGDQGGGRPLGQVDIGGERNAVGTASLPLDAWSHLAATYDGSVVRLYVNGASAGSVSYPGVISASNGVLRLGGNSVWPEWFSGVIDEVRIYNRALSVDEIRGDMNTPIGVPADVQAPAAPTGLALTGQTQTELTLTWSASTDNVGVTGYGSYRNGTLAGNGSGTSYTFTGLMCGTSYTLAVDAYDAAGNRSSRSSINASTSACPSVSALVAAYSFDAGSGSVVTDASGRGNTGTISGATWTSAGRSGGALSFDGVNDLVTVADAASLDLGTGMTLEAWVRPEVNNSWRTIVTKEQTGNLAYGLFSSSDTAQPSSIVSIGANATQDIVRAPSALPVSTWKHLATTYDGAVLRLYVDGVQVGTKNLSGAMPNSSGPLQIGGNKVWSEWFQGQIDDLRIYNRALSAAEVQADRSTPVGGGTTTPPPADTQAPTAPTGLAVGDPTQNGVTLSWNASSDNVGVTGYGVYRDGTNVGSTNPSTRSYNATGLACGTTYSFAVDAADAAGNRSTRTTLSGTTSACTSPPPSGVINVAPGGDLRAAYNAVPNGGTIQLSAGNYGGFSTPSGSKDVTLRGVYPGTVLNSIGVNADNFHVEYVTLDNEMSSATNTLFVSPKKNFSFKHGEIRNQLNQPMVMLNGSTVAGEMLNPVFDDVFFHDAVSNNAGVHMECVYSQASGLTIRNSRFENCAVMDVFITRGDWWQQPIYKGITLENNTFGTSRSVNGTCCSSYGVVVNGNMQEIRDFTIRNNFFAQGVAGFNESPWVGTNVVCGNTGGPPTTWKTAC